MKMLIKKYDTTALEHGQVIIDLIQGLIDSKHDFQAFMAICTGIEYLGSFSDAFPHNKFGESQSRFERALKTLFTNEWYGKNARWSFQQLRGPLLHQYRTGDAVLLTSRCCHPGNTATHLCVEEDKTIFVLEDLFEDFRSAYENLKVGSSDTEKYGPGKLRENYSTVYGYSESNVSGTGVMPELSMATGGTGSVYITSTPVNTKPGSSFKSLKNRSKRKRKKQ